MKIKLSELIEVDHAKLDIKDRAIMLAAALAMRDRCAERMYEVNAGYRDFEISSYIKLLPADKLLRDIEVSDE